MGQVLYFMASEESGFPQAIKAVGLDDRLSDNVTRQPATGPEGKQGLILVHGSGTKLAYKPDEQTWAGPFAEGRLWIGFWTNDRPTPADLERGDLMPANEVTSADGSAWKMPIARFAPRAMLVKDGKLTFEPGGMWERLWAHVEKLVENSVYNGSEDKTSIEVDLLRALEIIADALSINYRISSDPAQELSLLRVVSTHDHGAFIRAFMDSDAIEQEGAESPKDEAPSET